VPAPAQAQNTGGKENVQAKIREKGEEEKKNTCRIKISKEGQQQQSKEKQEEAASQQKGYRHI
jgi:hypothetical protein